jgi:hypothetical protein
MDRHSPSSLEMTQTFFPAGWIMESKIKKSNKGTDRKEWTSFFSVLGFYKVLADR